MMYVLSSAMAAFVAIVIALLILVLIGSVVNLWLTGPEERGR